MILFQIADPVVYHLDLFFYHRHAFGKTVMLSDFSGQLFHLGLHNGLGDLLAFLALPCSGSAGNYNSDKGQTTGD